jgi:RNA polymerase subunit RPABC4/transcription elongation factor Spt4
MSETCSRCGNEIPPPSQMCPHCGEGGRFWNVLATMEPDERSVLDRRYEAAKKDGQSRRVEKELEDFEKAVANSRAVITRYYSEVLRLASSPTQIYGTFYQLIDAGMRLPDGNEWDVFRELADSILFPGYKKDIRFGALSLDGGALSNWGDCSMVLREEMIADRTSVFEENSALFVERQNIPISRTAKIPKGYRAAWNEREKLAVAKLFSRIDSGTTVDKYSRILLESGAICENDQFIEVHIFGPVTVLSMEQVVVIAPDESSRATIRRAIKSKLRKHKVTVS